MALDRVVKYHLGNSLYAFANTRGGATKIHIRHFTCKSVRSKTGDIRFKSVPSVRGVSLDLDEFKRLMFCQNNCALTII